MAYKGDSRSWETSLGWPTELHGHAVECERGQYLSHDTETGMFDGEASAEYILGLTQFPSRYGHPSVDALATKVSHGTQTSKENKPTSIFCGKIFHLSSFPCCVVKYRDLSLRRQFCHATPISCVPHAGNDTQGKGRKEKNARLERQRRTCYHLFFVGSAVPSGLPAHFRTREIRGPCSGRNRGKRCSGP